MQILWIYKFLSVKQTQEGENIQPPMHTHLLEMCITCHQHTDALQTARSGCFMNRRLSTCVLKKTQTMALFTTETQATPARFLICFIYWSFRDSVAYLLVCISTCLQQPKQAESLTSACRKMRRRLSVSWTTQLSIHSISAFKKITRAVQLNGYSMKPHLNQLDYYFLGVLKRVI